MNISRSQAKLSPDNVPVDGPPVDEAARPGFLLSATPPAKVTLTPDLNRQTLPTKQEAELLADGQCEV